MGAAIENFYAITVGENEVAFMPLGSASNILVRVGDKTLLFDPASFVQEELTAINKYGVDLVIYTHDHPDHFNSGTAAQLYEGSKPSFVADKNMAPYFKGSVPKEKLLMAVSGQSYTSGGIKIDAIEGKHVGSIMLYRPLVHTLTDEGGNTLTIA